MNLSFAGCGFLGIYHIGVGACLKKYAPHLLVNKISGASAGAIAACCLLCDIPIGTVTSDMLNLVREARNRTLGPFSPSFDVQNYLYTNLCKVLPEDAHERVNGKLHISLTRIYDCKNVIVSQFASREELLEALLASAFVPIFSGFMPPMFQGERYIDGGFSDNLPTLDENTITVSPFCGETDICPRDYSSQLFHVNFANTSIELSKQNAHRFARTLWPPDVEVLSKLCKQGFDDALRFLHRNNLIKCAYCVSVQSTLSESIIQKIDFNPQCQRCKLNRQEALVANLPDQIASIFQDAIDSANKGFYNWMLSYRGMKLISVMSLPYVIPLKFSLLILKKASTLLPIMCNNVLVVYQFCCNVVEQMLPSISSNPTNHKIANIFCQLKYSNVGCNVKLNDVYEKELNFNIDMEKKLLPTDNWTTNRLLRKVSIEKSLDELVHNETMEDIMRVASQQDAIVAFSYLDGNNKVKITEIYDVTDNGGTISHGDNVRTVLNDSDDSQKIMSDPESEWTAKYAEDPKDSMFSRINCDLPESDQGT